MAFRDYSNNDPFDRADERRYRDPRAFDDRSDYPDEREARYRYGNDHDESRGGYHEQSRYADTNWRNGPAPRNRYVPPLERNGGPYRDNGSYNDREMRASQDSYNDRYSRDRYSDDPYLRDQRRLREQGEMRYGRDYGYADGSYYYYDHRRQAELDDEYGLRYGSENVDAQQNYERDRPNFRGGGWDQGESMRSSHSMPSRREREAFEGDRGYERDTSRRSAREQGRYSSQPDAWSSMEHDWNGEHYYGGGHNRTGDYGSSGERYNWRDNFGRDRTSSRSGRGTTTGWAGGDRSLGSSDLGA